MAILFAINPKKMDDELYGVRLNNQDGKSSNAFFAEGEISKDAMEALKRGLEPHYTERMMLDEAVAAWKKVGLDFISREQ